MSRHLRTGREQNQLLVLSNQVVAFQFNMVAFQFNKGCDRWLWNGDGANVFLRKAVKNHIDGTRVVSLKSFVGSNGYHSK